MYLRLQHPANSLLIVGNWQARGGDTRNDEGPRSTNSLVDLPHAVQTSLKQLGIALVTLSGPQATGVTVSEDLEGLFGSWLDDLDADLVLVRPDLHVYDVGTGAHRTVGSPLSSSHCLGTMARDNDRTRALLRAGWSPGRREACAYVACPPSDTESNPHGLGGRLGVLLFSPDSVPSSRSAWPPSSNDLDVLIPTAGAGRSVSTVLAEVMDDHGGRRVAVALLPAADQPVTPRSRCRPRASVF